MTCSSSSRSSRRGPSSLTPRASACPPGSDTPATRTLACSRPRKCRLSLMGERVVTVGNRRVGDGEPCFIVAEAGANHNRDLGMARELIAVAAEAGADAVKFQTYSAETLYSRQTPAFSYLQAITDKTTWQLIKDIELPRHWHAELAAEATKRGILFMSTPFDHTAVDELDAVGVPAFK